MSKKDFMKLKVIVPPIEIQKEIGKILTVADNEINILEDYRNALDQQKRGLMQKLLTGEVRLIVWGDNGKNYDFVVIMKKNADGKRWRTTSFYVDKVYKQKDFERKCANRIK